MKQLTRLLLSSLMASTMCLAQAQTPEDLGQLQQQWATVKYQQEQQAQPVQTQHYADLIVQAENARKQHPEDARYLIWEGIIRASYAGSKGGLDALSEVKAAKTLFEQAIALDKTALDGSAYTSLGSLYYQVPGWPIGFGSDKKAREYLLKGLEINPTGIDANYFYGDFLLQQKEYRAAIAVLEKAQQAPARPGREAADLGRQNEIAQALTKARGKVKS